MNADARASLARPTPAQLAWHDLELGMFIHWSPATFQDTSTGCDNRTTPLEAINPTALDTDQWADVAVSMGARYIVLVAKHVGGFCLWQTDTTRYGVAGTPWREGRGDIVADLAQSCRARGLKLGVYLSPRDDNFGAATGGICPTPEQQAAYQTFYRQQLTELLTRYGEMLEVWFDGSNVVEMGDLLAAHAPDAMIFQSRHANIRWVGNEDGIATYPAWNTCSLADAQSGNATNRHGTPDGEAWLPLECDARIRSDWFWTPRNAPSLKSIEQLMEMYYRSVGNGAVLLLNHTPDTTGAIPAADAARAAEFGAEIARRFAHPLAETSGAGEVVELDLGAPRAVDHLVLMEDLTLGERVRVYTVDGWDGQAWVRLCHGTAVGHKRLERFSATTLSKLRFTCHVAAAPPVLRRFAAYHTAVPYTGAAPEPARTSVKVGEWGSEIYYGLGWGGRGAQLEYDLSAAVDDAGQFELRLSQTSGDDGFEVVEVGVQVSGVDYPSWVSATPEPRVWNLSFPGVDPQIRLKLTLRGVGGPSAGGVIWLTRRP